MTHSRQITDKQRQITVSSHLAKILKSVRVTDFSETGMDVQVRLSKNKRKIITGDMTYSLFYCSLI
jgi:hypothetical protein